VHTQLRNGSANSWLWLAGAVGTAAGLAALAYSRKPRSRWDRARDTVAQRADDARKQMTPLLGAAAGLAAGCATATYRIGKLYPRMKRMLA
jgi:hypothetical protein